MEVVKLELDVVPLSVVQSVLTGYCPVVIGDITAPSGLKRKIIRV